MTPQVCAGDTYLIDWGTPGTKHLWVVLAVYDESGTLCAVLANVTSVRRGCDQSCILTPANADGHPFIKQDSFVFYAEMRKEEVSDLNGHSAYRHVSVTKGVLERMQRGVHASKFTRRGMRVHVPNPDT